MEYKCEAKDYLGRARDRLVEANPEALFYTALELRCGIEARLKEYFDAQAETTKKKRKGWQISKLAKQVEAVFKAREKVIRLVVFDPETNSVISDAFYTPVTSKLQKLGEQLGGYLHASDKKRSKNGQWLAVFREKLNETYRELEFSVSGTLMAPPLEHTKKPGKLFFCLTGDQTKLFPPGKRIGIRFEKYELTKEVGIR
ncbi:MAG TPA: hypothetical protein VIH22_17275 [Cyclobacteriaceae bacterium]|nr:hypothetical protein [Thermodesulfovibrionia bacterium]